MCKIDFWILKENSYYAQNGVNGSSVRTGLHCDLVLISNDFHSNLCNYISAVPSLRHIKTDTGYNPHYTRDRYYFATIHNNGN